MRSDGQISIAPGLDLDAIVAAGSLGRDEALLDVGAHLCRVALRGVAEAAAAASISVSRWPGSSRWVSIGSTVFPSMRCSRSPPGLPPMAPSAGKRVRLAMLNTVMVALASLRITTSWPRPPRAAAGPPESGRRRFDSIVVPVSVSHTSTGTTAMFDGPGVTLAPSQPESAPKPPAAK